MKDVEIFRWLNKQKYQKESDDTGEFEMYFDVDMPRILNDFYKMVNTSYKVCAKCATLKDFSKFHKNNKTKDGLHVYCKECRKITKS